MSKEGMKSPLRSWMTLLFIAVIGMAMNPISEDEVFIDVDEAEQYPGFMVQGEYTGHLYTNDGNDKMDIGLQAAALQDNQFRAMLYYGGLPGDRTRPIKEGDKYEMDGVYQQGDLEFEAENQLRFKYTGNRFTVLDEQNNYMGHLEKVRRKSPTLGKKPPEDAKVLFDGTNLDYWDESTGMSEDGLLKQGATTADEYGDMYLHVEAKLGFMPHQRDQNRANSGIYIQNRYEMQILDSFSFPARIDGNGSLYREEYPRVNASYPPLTWQTYDVFFRAPRFDENGNKTENARITAYLNGVLMHDEVELEQGTGAGGSREEVPKAQLYLQDHGGDPVRFRNIWVVEGEPSSPAATIGW